MSERRLSEQSTRPFSDKGDILGSFFVTKNLPKKEPVGNPCFWRPGML
jgi:hypothetical protein